MPQVRRSVHAEKPLLAPTKPSDLLKELDPERPIETRTRKRTETLLDIICLSEKRTELFQQGPSLIGIIRLLQFLREELELAGNFLHFKGSFGHAETIQGRNPVFDTLHSLPRRATRDALAGHAQFPIS